MKLLEDMVFSGVSVVEKVYKVIFNIMFGFIDLFFRDEEFWKSVRKVWEVYDYISEGVYKIVWMINKVLYIFVDILIIGKVEKWIMFK